MGMFGNASPSLADIAAVTRNNDGNNNNDGFGAGNGWWILIILFAIFGGWGNNGYGNNGGCSDRGETTVIMAPPSYGCGGAGMYGGFGFGEAALQRGFDTQAIISKLDGINGGICSLGYDQLAQMNGINNTILHTGFGITNGITNSTFALQNAINADSVANMQNTNALSRQMADCCCENRAAIAQVRYDMATDTCALKNEVRQTGDAIIQSQNAGFQMLNNTINDRFTRMELEQKNQKIADLQLALNNCDRDKALANQSTYLLNVLSPQARPSYIVQNPNCCAPLPVTVQENCGPCCGQRTY